MHPLSRGMRRMTPAAAGADVRLESITQDRLRSGTKTIAPSEVTDEDAIERHTRNLNLVTTLERAFDAHWSLALRVPVVKREHLHDLFDAKARPARRVVGRLVACGVPAIEYGAAVESLAQGSRRRRASRTGEQRLDDAVAVAGRERGGRPRQRLRFRAAAGLPESQRHSTGAARFTGHGLDPLVLTSHQELFE